MRRTVIGALVLSAAGFVSIALHEGYRGEAYVPVPNDRATLGFGTTENVKLGDKTTPPAALERALRDVAKFEGAAKKCIKVPMHQHEYDVAISFSYNVGAAAFCSSTFVKKLNAGDYAGACAELSRWVKVKGRVVQGLVNRRAAERAKCEGKP